MPSVGQQPRRQGGLCGDLCVARLCFSAVFSEDSGASVRVK